MGIEISAAAVAAAASVAGTVVSAVGAMANADAQAKQAEYQGQVARNNQITANNNAQMAAQAGEIKAFNKEQQTRATVGAIKAAEAGSGIDVNTGTAVDVQAGAAETGMTDALTIRSDAMKTAYGYETQAVGFANQAQLDEMQAENAPITGAFNAGGTLLSGGANAYYNYKKSL